MKNNQKFYLYDAVKKIDLKAFVERESGARLENKGKNSWVGICPFHKDSEPSFFVTQYHNGVWVYKCFGCQSKGTIIDYCVEKFDLSSPHEAVVLIAEKEGIKCDESLIIKTLKEAKIQIDKKNELDIAHYVASCVCRKILRQFKDNQYVTSWVAKSYDKMNKILDNEKSLPLEFSKISNEGMRMVTHLHDKENENETKNN